MTFTAYLVLTIIGVPSGTVRQPPTLMPVASMEACQEARDIMEAHYMKHKIMHVSICVSALGPVKK